MNKNQYKYTHIPTHYIATKELDERFLQIKVYVLHTGENYNGSIFEKEVVERAIPSLANTPILAFVKSENQKDFAGHEIDLVIENGEYRWKYKGQAYGVIPERNNARWEFMIGSDGIEREYLVVDAIVWKKFDDAVEIISRDLIKGQSMELSEKYSGHFNDKGLFVFDNFKFDGCAILGEDVEPAMNSAKVEMQFSMANIKNAIGLMMEEYNRKFSKEVYDVNIEELLQQYGLTKEQVIEAGVDLNHFNESNIEKFKEELEKIMRGAEQKSNMPEKLDTMEELNKEEIVNPQEKEIQNDKENLEFDGKKDKSEGEKNEPQDLEKNEKQNNQNNANDFKNGEEKRDSKNDKDNDEKDEKDLEDKFQLLQDKFSKLEEQYQDLLTYKQNREQQDHQDKVEKLIASFEKLTDEDVKEVREKLFSLSYEEIEEKLYAILGKKEASSKEKKQSQFAKFYVTENVDNEVPKPSYDHLFRKHLNK